MGPHLLGLGTGTLEDSDIWRQGHLRTVIFGDRAIWGQEYLGSHLLGHLGLGAELQQAPGEGGGAFEILEFEEEVEGGAEHQDHVHGLQVGVCEVGGHLPGKGRKIRIQSLGIMGIMTGNRSVPGSLCCVCVERRIANFQFLPTSGISHFNLQEAYNFPSGIPHFPPQKLHIFHLRNSYIFHLTNAHIFPSGIPCFYPQ